MADTTDKAPEPLTTTELPAFLLWFFTNTGRAAHVKTWRDETSKKTHDPDDA